MDKIMWFGLTLFGVACMTVGWLVVEGLIMAVEWMFTLYDRLD